MMRRTRRDRTKLAHFWNALVEGRRPAPDGLDPDLASTIAALHAGDDAPSPDPGFAHRLEEQLMMIETGVPAAPHGHVRRPFLVRAMPRQAWRSEPLGSARLALPAVVLLLAVLAIVAAFVGLPRFRDDDTSGGVIPAALAPSPTAEAFAATPAGDAASNAVPAVPGCTTQPREPGRVEELFAQGAPSGYGLFPRDSGDVNHAPALLDGDAYVERFTTGPADRATIDAINATLAQLAACHYYFFASDGKADLDGRYYANFSDDYFSLQFASPKYDKAMIEHWNGWYTGVKDAPVVEQAWVTTDGRIMATVLTGREFEENVRTAMIFAQVGDRWLVDEVAQNLVFESRPELPERADESIETLEIAIYDADAPRNPGTDGNYSFLGAYAPDYPFIADGGLIIRLVNLGTLPHRFTIAELDVDQTLEPGGLVDVPINAPVGTYEWAIYEGDSSEPTATHTLELVAPGTQRGKG